MEPLYFVTYLDDDMAVLEWQIGSFRPVLVRLHFPLSHSMVMVDLQCISSLGRPLSEMVATGRETVQSATEGDGIFRMGMASITRYVGYRKYSQYSYWGRG